jgi:hypothetical protein
MSTKLAAAGVAALVMVTGVAIASPAQALTPRQERVIRTEMAQAWRQTSPQERREICFAMDLLGKPFMRELLRDEFIAEARQPGSPGGRRVTRAERKLATDGSRIVVNFLDRKC